MIFVDTGKKLIFFPAPFARVFDRIVSLRLAEGRFPVLSERQEYEQWEVITEPSLRMIPEPGFQAAGFFMGLPAGMF